MRNSIVFQWASRSPFVPGTVRLAALFILISTILAVISEKNVAGSKGLTASAGGGQMSAAKASYSGQFYIIWGDPAPGQIQEPKIRYFLATDKGETLELSFPSADASPAMRPELLNGRRVTVEGMAIEPSDENSGASTALVQVSGIEPEEPASDGGGASSLALSGNLKYINVLCRFADSPTNTPKPPSYFDSLFSGAYPGIGQYWAQMSYGAVTMGGTATTPTWYNLPNPRSHYLYVQNGVTLANTQALGQDCAAAADADVYFPDFDGINFIFNDSLGAYAYGTPNFVLTIDGQNLTRRATWLPPFAFSNQRIAAHEVGHSLGLDHTSGMYNTPYDSSWDPMGISGESGYCNNSDPIIGCIAPAINAYHKDYLGWIAASKKFVAPYAGTTQISIKRLDVPPQNRNYLMAVVPIDGSATKFFTIEARKFSGYDITIPGEAILIHKVDTTLGDRRARVVDPDLNSDPNDAGARWLPGETYYDPESRVTITVDSADFYSFTVTITTDPCVYAINPGSQNFSAAGGTGSVTVTTQAGCAWSASDLPPVIEYQNETLTTINDAPDIPNEVGTANPYPSILNISNSATVISKVTVNLKGIIHSKPGDIDALLIAPSGQKVMLMSDVSSDAALNGVSLSFDQEAATQVPQSGPISGGTYLPANYAVGAITGDLFPAPGPGFNKYDADLNIFRGLNPNGDWQLFIVDDAFNGSGSMVSWALKIRTGWFRSETDTHVGSGTLSFTVDPNSGPARSGTFTIAGQTFAVTQSAP